MLELLEAAPVGSRAYSSKTNQWYRLHPTGYWRTIPWKGLEGPHSGWKAEVLIVFAKLTHLFTPDHFTAARLPKPTQEQP